MFRLDAGTFHAAGARLPDGARTRFGVQLLVGRLAEYINAYDADSTGEEVEHDEALLSDLRALVPLIDDAWFADLSPAKQRSGEFTGLGERWHSADEIRNDILQEAFRDTLGGQAIVHLACLCRELPHFFCAYVAAVHDKLFLPSSAILHKNATMHELAPHFDDWIHPERFCDYDGHDSRYNDADARFPIGGISVTKPKLRWNPPALQLHDDASASGARMQQAVHEALWITAHDYNDRLLHSAAVAAGAVPDFDGTPLGTLVDFLYRHAPEELQRRVDAERGRNPCSQVGPWETLHAARMAVRSVPQPLGLWFPDAPGMQRRLVFKDAVQLATVGTCAPTHSPGAMLCPGQAVYGNSTRLAKAFSAVNQAQTAIAKMVGGCETDAGDGQRPMAPLDVMARQDIEDLAATFTNLPCEVGVDVVVAIGRLGSFWPGELKTMTLQYSALNAPGAEYASARLPLFVPMRKLPTILENAPPATPAGAKMKTFSPVPLALMAAACPDARLLARMAGRPSPPRAGFREGLSPPTQLGDAPLCAALRLVALITVPAFHPIRKRAASDAAWPDVAHTLVKLGIMHACTAATAMACTARSGRLLPTAGEQPSLCGLSAVFRLVALAPEGAAALAARDDRWAVPLRRCRNSPVFHAARKQAWFQTPFGSLVRNDVDRHVRRWLALVVHMGLALAHGRGADAWRDRELFGESGGRRAVVGGPEGLLCCASATDASNPVTNAFVLSPPAAELATRDPAERARALRNLETLACTAAIALYGHTVRLLGNPDPAVEAGPCGLEFLDASPTFFLVMRRIGRQYARSHRAQERSTAELQLARLERIVADVVAASIGDPANETPPCERARHVRRSLWTLLPTPSAFAYTYGYAGAWGDGPAALQGWVNGLPGDERPVYPQDPVSPGDAYGYTLGFALLQNLILAGMPSRALFEQTLKDMDLGAVRGDEDNPAGGEWVFRLIQITACVAGCDLDGHPVYATLQGLRARPADEYKTLMRDGHDPLVVARRKAEELTRDVARDPPPHPVADDHPHRLSSEDAAWTIKALVSALPTAACVATRYLVTEELKQVYFKVERAHWWMLGPTAKMPPRRHWFPGSEPHEPDELWPPYDDDPESPDGVAVLACNQRTLYWLHTCCPSAVWPLYKRGGTGWKTAWFERCLVATRETRPDQVALAAQLMLPCPEGLMLDPPDSAPFLMRIQQELFAPGGDGYRALLSSSTAAATMLAPGTGSAPGAPAEPDDGSAPAAKRHCPDRPSADTAPR